MTSYQTSYLDLFLVFNSMTFLIKSHAMSLAAISNWDIRYLRLAKYVAQWSKDPSTQCGAILVRPNRTMASVGFNGFAREMSDDADLYNDRPVKYSRVIHSEWNAIRSSRDHDLTGYSVYAWPMPPCDNCTNCLIQKGISRCICPAPSADKLERWATQFSYALQNWKQVKAQFNYHDNPNDLILLPEPTFIGSPQLNHWQRRFLHLASEIMTWSKDPIEPRSTILVRPEKTIASIGFNGFPQGIDDQPLLDGDLEARSATMILAEQNALLFSREPSVAGLTAYTFGSTIDMRGIVHLIHEGIRDFVVAHPEDQPMVSDQIKNALAEVNGTLIELTYPVEDEKEG